MKKLVFVAVILLGVSALAMAAEEFPKVEVFGGYSFLRCQFGSPTKPCIEDGWNTSVAINGNQYLSFVADFAGVYDQYDAPYQHNAVYTYMFGPKITVRKGKLAPYFVALLGNARVTPGLYFPYDNQFAMSFGGGLDISVSKLISIRPAQISWLGVKYQKPMIDNMRYSVGVVFKFKQPK
jgi:hypothetical protein